MTLGSQVTGGRIDLGLGNDKLVLDGTSNNTLTVANAETIIGGSSADVITISGAISGVVDLGAGTDSLTLGASVPRSRSSTSRPSPAAPVPTR